MPKRILLVDDDIDFINANRLLIEQAGFEVVVAQTEKEALDQLEKQLPDLAVVDLILENVDGGFNISYQIKKRDPNIPVILVTSVSHDYGFTFDADTDEERSWVKADMVVDKPVRFEQLLSDIKLLLKE
ncbi:MAG: response regulator [Phycisphaerae bacterium]